LWRSFFIRFTVAPRGCQSFFSAAALAHSGDKASGTAGDLIPAFQTTHYTAYNFCTFVVRTGDLIFVGLFDVILVQDAVAG